MASILNDFLRTFINVMCLIVGFAITADSSVILYTSAHQTDNCIMDKIEFTIVNDSSDHKTINATALYDEIPTCGIQANSDFPYAVLQIMGLFIPVISVVATVKFKEGKKQSEPLQLSPEDRKDALGNRGYSC